MSWARQHKLLATIVGIGSALIALFAVFVFIPWILGDLKLYKIPSDAMSPTLKVGDRIAARKSEGKVGEIVTFHPPVAAIGFVEDPCAGTHPPSQACSTPPTEQAKNTFVSRIVAGPGDTVAFRNGQVVLNGKLQAGGPSCEEAEDVAGECDLPRPVKVPENHYFVAGDNRGGALDSRIWGPLRKEWVTGHVVFRYYPLDRFGSP